MTQMNDYTLLLKVPEAASEKIIACKKLVEEKFKIQATYAKPLIVLCTFKQTAACESRFMPLLSSIARSTPTIRVALEDFQAIPTHSIFINIEARQTLADFIKTIRVKAGQYMRTDKWNKPFFTHVPYIGLVKKLSNQQFEEAWLWARHQHFRAAFMVSEMQLLRKEQEAPFRIAATFVLEGKPQEAAQVTLF